MGAENTAKTRKSRMRLNIIDFLIIIVLIGAVVGIAMRFGLVERVTNQAGMTGARISFLIRDINKELARLFRHRGHLLRQGARLPARHARVETVHVFRGVHNERARRDHQDELGEQALRRARGGHRKRYVHGRRFPARRSELCRAGLDHTRPEPGYSTSS